jgi:hypothetical protein
MLTLLKNVVCAVSLLAGRTQGGISRIGLAEVVVFNLPNADKPCQREERRSSLQIQSSLLVKLNLFFVEKGCSR